MTIKAFGHTTSDNLHYVKGRGDTPLPTPLFLSLLLPYRQLPQKRGLLLAVSEAFEAFKRVFLPKNTIEALKVLINFELKRFKTTFPVTRRGFQDTLGAQFASTALV